MTSEELATRYYHAWLYWSAYDEASSAYERWRTGMDLWIDGHLDHPGPPPGGLLPELAHMPMTPRMELERRAVLALERVMLCYDEHGMSPVLAHASGRLDEQELAHRMLVAWLGIVLEDNEVLREEIIRALDAELEALRGD